MLQRGTRSGYKPRFPHELGLLMGRRTLAVVVGVVVTVMALGACRGGSTTGQSGTVGPPASPPSSAGAGTLPDPSGPLLRIEDEDFPFSIQGVMAQLAPEVAGEPAPASSLYLLVALRIRSLLPDRGIKAPHIPTWNVQYPPCAPRCYAPLEYVSDLAPPETTLGNFPPPPLSASDVVVPPGEGYNVWARALVPRSVDPGRLYLRIRVANEKYVAMPRLLLGNLLGVTPTAVLDLPPAYIGTWEGVIRQGRSSYKAILNFEGGRVGTVVGSSSYPTLGCVGELIFSDGTATLVTMDEESRGGSCSGGSFTLALNPNGSLTYRWLSHAFPESAQGTLRRSE